jgi:phosphate:Na+ symporter
MMHELDISMLLMGLLGGLAIFLHGMDTMTAALKAVAGDGMKTLLKKLTSNRLAAAFTGAGVTAVIQSSSVTTVLVVGFISAGVMNLQQSIGVIMGANIGTTITAQVIAFKVTKYALGLVFIGWFPLFFLRKENLRQASMALMGLGVVFLGMTLMSEATHPLRTYQPFMDWMQNLESPLLGVLLGAAFTALVQSSSATTGIVIMLASQGLLPLEGGIALCMGANIGTCFTALLASIGKRREVLQAVGIHIMFNVLGVIIWFAFIPEISLWMIEVSPQSLGLVGLEKLAVETPRQIANAHTFFNVANTLLLIPFAGRMANWIEWAIPIKEEQGKEARVTHLDHNLLKTPSFALVQVRLECLELGDKVVHFLDESKLACLGEKKWDGNKNRDLEDEIDELHKGIVSYLAKLSRQKMNGSNAMRLGHYLQLANYLENMGDTLNEKLQDLVRGFSELPSSMSERTKDHFESLFKVVKKSLHDVMAGLKSEETHLAEGVIALKTEVMEMAFDISHRLEERLKIPGDDRLSLYRLEVELTETMRQLFYLTKTMAKVVLDLDGAREKDQ